MRIGPRLQQRFNGGRARTIALRIENQRSSAAFGDAIGIDALTESFSNQVGVAPLRGEHEEFFKLPAVFGIAGHIAKSAHGEIVARTTADEEICTAKENALCWKRARTLETGFVALRPDRPSFWPSFNRGSATY